MSNEPRRYPLNEDELEGIVTDWNKGLTTEQICDKYDVKANTLYRMMTKLRKRGVPVIRRHRGQGSSIYNNEALIDRLKSAAESASAGEG